MRSDPQTGAVPHPAAAGHTATLDAAPAPWRSGYAAACKAVYTGSILVGASVAAVAVRMPPTLTNIRSSVSWHAGSRPSATSSGQTGSRPARWGGPPGARRFVFNWALQRWRSHYAQFGESPTRAQLCRELTELKHRPGQEWMLEISSSVMQQSIVDVWRAYRSFFRGQTRYPGSNRRSSTASGSDTPPESGSQDRRSSFRESAGFASGCRAPVEGRVKSVTVKQHAGRWFVLVLTEFEVSDAKPTVRASADVVGIDLGLTRLATLSDGFVVAPPRFARRGRRKVRRAERALRRKEPTSRNRKKERLRLAKVHARIAARRKDFLHKLTTSVVDSYDGILRRDPRYPRACENQAVPGCLGCCAWRVLASSRVQGGLAAKTVRGGGALLSVDEDVRGVRRG